MGIFGGYKTRQIFLLQHQIAAPELCFFGVLASKNNLFYVLAGENRDLSRKAPGCIRRVSCNWGIFYDLPYLASRTLASVANQGHQPTNIII